MLIKPNENVIKKCSAFDIKKYYIFFIKVFKYLV